MSAAKVSEEIEAWCPTCKTTKWQIVVALVAGKPAKLECIGCHRQHGLRSPRATHREALARPRPAPPPPVDLDARLVGREGQAQPYSPRATYAVDDVIRHPSFGLGLVVAAPGPQRIEVQFRAARKLLAHGQDEPGGPRLTRPARQEEPAEEESPPSRPARRPSK
jgi:hypothetical protein